MYSRRENSDVIYPFTPETGVSNALRCVLDCFFALSRTGTSSNRTSLPDVTADYHACLTRLKVGHSAVFSFLFLFPGGERSVDVVVPKNSGIVRRSPSDEGISGALVVDTNELPSGVTDFSPPAELEPARVCWQMDEVSKISVFNEWRTPDVTARTTGMSVEELRDRVAALEAENPLRDYSNPDDHVAHESFMPLLEKGSSESGVVSFKNGHNCELEYDRSTGVLTVRGVSGAGTGLPAVDDIPWDEAPAVTEAETLGGMMSINGVSGKNVKIRMSESIFAEYEEGRVTLDVKREDDDA